MTAVAILSQNSKNGLNKFPRVIGHRGACGTYPEHTLAGFRKAIADGANVIEIDTAISKEGEVIVMHEPELSVSTDALELKQKGVQPFSNEEKLRTLTITSEDGYSYTKTDLWCFDFTLPELKQLKRKQVLSFRNQQHNGKFSIPTLRELINNVVLRSTKKVVLLIEMKTCQFFTDILQENKIDKTVEDLIIDVLAETDVLERPDIIELQSFEETTLVKMKEKAPQLKVHMLLYMRSQLDVSHFERWRQLGFFGIGVHKELVTVGSKYDSDSPQYTDKYTITGVSNLVAKSHSYGMEISVWTLQNEDQYLAWNFEQNGAKEIMFHAGANVDGLITDFPLTAREALNRMAIEQEFENYYDEEEQYIEVED